MVSDYGFPAEAAAQEALESLAAINPSGPTAPKALLEAKARFALGWSALALSRGAEFSDLGHLQTSFADRSIDLALRTAWKIEAKALKLKKIPDTVPGLFIFGLGKLGGTDLNFSSDVDLIAFYDPDTLPVPTHMGQGYIVNKVLKTMTRILKPRNSAEFIWRVDWRLRPESSASQLAMPIDMAQEFYFFRALPWHRLALMKARVVAGDIETGEKFLDTITPFIWRQNLDFRALDELAHLKSRINLEHPALRQQRAAPEPITADAAGFNVKLGSGGIREIEFIANAQQLVWGGKHYSLRTSNTLEALTELTKLGHLDEAICERLSGCYKAFRNLENAIQMLGNEQTHIVPSSPEQQQAILILLGEDDWDIASQQIEKMRRFVSAEFGNIFEASEPEAGTSGAFENSLKALAPRQRDIVQGWLNGFDIQLTGSKNKHKFQQLGIRLLERIFNSSGDTEIAIDRIDSFFSALSRSEQYLHLLASNQNLLDALIPPLIHSPHMTLLLTQSPHIIDVFLTPRLEMDTDFIFHSSDYETRLERLRRFVNEALFISYTEFMSGGGTAKTLHSQLTALADKTIAAALRIVTDDLELNHLPLTVLGLGKMGTSRMSPLSDIDLIFIFEDGTDGQLAQKIIRRLRTVLTAKLREGIAYELDMRLRPSGRSGPPAVMLQSFREHHNTRAHNWEHIALTHSRIVAGDKTLGEKVIAIRDKVLSRPRDRDQFLSDAKTMWQRIADQRSADTPPDIFNSKLRAGGLMQAEYSEACQRILGETQHGLEGNIDFWSNMQLWERLLGLANRPLSALPNFYKNHFLSQMNAKSIKALAKLQTQHIKLVTKSSDAIFNSRAVAANHAEARILWTD